MKRVQTFETWKIDFDRNCDAPMREERLHIGYEERRSRREKTNRGKVNRTRHDARGERIGTFSIAYAWIRERRGSPFHIVCSHGPRPRIKAARNAWFSHAEQRIERTEGAQEGEKRTEKKDDHVRFSRCARAVPFAERLSKLRQLHTHVTTSCISFSPSLLPLATGSFSFPPRNHFTVKAVTVKGDCSTSRVSFPVSFNIRIDSSVFLFLSLSLFYYI